MTIKAFLNYFFVTLGVIFFILILLLSYLWFFDPLEIRPLLQNRASEVEVNFETKAEAMETTQGDQKEEVPPAEVKKKNTVLTPAQEDALQLVGIDSGLIPEEITQTEKDCLVRVIGQERVNEITAGTAPSVLEILKGKDCII